VTNQSTQNGVYFCYWCITMTITLKAKSQLVVPPSVQRKARLKAGDRVEFKASPGVITIIGKPSAAARATDDEYTPEQRRIVDREIAKGLEDVRKGRTYGPFDTADEAIQFLRKEIRARKATARKTARS
jgi:bifunctional DNA-binding transcriptional regulator/antitoxin component of YhaV-PrlF toxin-antitoxin module